MIKDKKPRYYEKIRKLMISQLSEGWNNQTENRIMNLVTKANNPEIDALLERFNQCKAKKLPMHDNYLA